MYYRSMPEPSFLAKEAFILGIFLTVSVGTLWVVIGRGRKGASLCDFLALFRSSYVCWRLYLVCSLCLLYFPLGINREFLG